MRGLRGTGASSEESRAGQGEFGKAEPEVRNVKEEESYTQEDRISGLQRTFSDTEPLHAVLWATSMLDRREALFITESGPQQRGGGGSGPRPQRRADWPLAMVL